MTDQISSSKDPLMPPKIVYGLYALGYFVGITSLAGVIYAYLSKGQHTLADSHLLFQIRTFWISLAIALVGLVTAFIGIGILVFVFLLVWGLTRIISGFLLLNDGKPITGTKYAGMLAI